MDLSFSQGVMERQLVYRMNENGFGPELLQQVFLERGWVEYDEEIHGEHGWNIWWRTSRFRTNEYFGLMSWQRINHYPNCTTITKKDALCRNLRKMRIAHGLNIYNFSPMAYNLPNDYTKFVSEYAKHRHSKDSTPLMWICKPAESSRGRGIFIFSDLTDLQYDCNAVVQQYITDPLLIGGYKFDIRVYVAVPSFHPLHVYVHEEGLVRFSTEKYDLERPDNVFAHLTNTSINKFSPGYTTDKDEVGHGCKWTISQLRRYFLQNNIADGPLWQKITNIIILTLLMQAPSAPRVMNCFELYGFDILVDSSLKPWLLEVNFSPALSCDCQADISAKKAMLHDLLDLMFKCDLGYESDMEMGLTDRTFASTSRSFRTSSRLSLQPQRVRPAGSTNTLRSENGAQDLRHHEITGSGSLQCQSPSSRKPSNAKDGIRYVIEKSSGEPDSQDTRKSMFKSQEESARRLSRPKSSVEHSQCKLVPSGELSYQVRKSISVHTDQQNNAQVSDSAMQERTQSEKDNRIGRDLKICYQSATDEGTQDAAGSNGNRDSEDDRKDAISANLVGKDNISVEAVGSKTSTHSDSGFSSLSLSSNDNIPLTSTTNSKSSTDLIKGGNTPEAAASNTNCSNSASKTCVGSALIHRLSELPEKLALGSITSSNADSDMIDHLHSAEDKTSSDIKRVPGNMRGVGVKKIVSPINSPSTAKAHKSHHRKIAGKEHIRGSGSSTDIKKISGSGKVHPQTRTRAHTFDPHPADNKRMIPFNIPRNFSRTEAHRFPHLYQHSRNPGKNGKAPLCKIPSRRVGRFFLVFPFNEATQKMSNNSKFDPKLVVRELQKLNKESEQPKKGVPVADSGWCDDLPGSIWRPLSCNDTTNVKDVTKRH